MAIDPARNIRRRYSITASLDLFGMIVVETRWGRIGAHGQAQRHAFADRAAADRHIAATLRRHGRNPDRGALRAGAYRGLSRHRHVGCLKKPAVLRPACCRLKRRILSWTTALATIGRP
ncbi:WGR domain-containing protein [Novosphingobium panipatense]